MRSQFIKIFLVAALAHVFTDAPAVNHAFAAPVTSGLEDSVDPRIGVLGSGSCVIGPSLPFALIHPSPDTPNGGYGGYQEGQPIRGFSQLHVSGTGWGQYGNFLISPQVGLDVSENGHDSAKGPEVIRPYEYQVRLDRYGVLARVGPHRRSAIYQFTFPATDQANVVFDVTQNIPRDIATHMKQRSRGAEVTISADGRILTGMGDFSGGFGGPYRAYFCAELDHSPTAAGTWKDDQILAGQSHLETSTTNERIGAFLRFTTHAAETITLKIAVSFLSVEQARQSLHAEIPEWDYAAVRENARETWRTNLNQIELTGGSADERTLFYTAMFHAMIMPRNRTGEFARFAPTTPMWDDHYAIWDTWRTLYPLFALIRPDVVRDTVNSFIERQRVDGAVPDTFIAGVNQFREQGGNGVDMIIGDAHAKKIGGIDWEKAYGVLKHDADQRRNGETFDNPKLGPGPYRKLGWIPAGIMSCSFTLEYAYDDFVASQVAAALGHPEDAKNYKERSRRWAELWNPDVSDDGFKGFIMPKRADGTWVAFDPKVYPGSWKNYFYEANSWTYSYFAPHQGSRLISLMGGRETFIARLVHALEAGLLKLDNEPSFLIPQLFHYVGRPDLSAYWLRHFTDKAFTLRGYPGDDDSGAMSSYLIWAKIGLFPNAGQDIYFLNGPSFSHVTVRRPEDAPLEITRTGSGFYIAAVSLNGQPFTRSWIRHAELQGPARLDFIMSEKPTSWAQSSPPPPSI